MLNAIFIAAGIVAFAYILCRVTAYCGDDANVRDYHEVHIIDFTFRDDHGNVYMVTAAHVNDAFDLLRDDHGLSPRYINQHVFLADTRKVF